MGRPWRRAATRLVALCLLVGGAHAQSCADEPCEACHASRGCTRHPSAACSWDGAACTTAGGATPPPPAPPPTPAPAPASRTRRSGGTPPPPPPGDTTAQVSTTLSVGDLGRDDRTGRAIDSNEGADWMANGNTVDNYGVDHSLMNGECTNLYDEPHGDGACANLISVGYRCRAYFCRQGSDFYGFCDQECECGACGTGPECGGTRCSAGQICSCDNVCLSPSAIGNGECDDELQGTGRLLNCAENQWDGGDCTALYDRPCQDHVDCDDGEMCSCEGKCAPGDWLGDRICDDASKPRGHNFDCVQFQDHAPVIAGTTRGDMGDCDWTRACGLVPENSAWGSLACRETEVCSCVNVCEPSWIVGDGDCEEGQQGHHLNCARFEYDGGDCEGSTGCWDAQGPDACASYFAQGMTCDTQIGTNNPDMVVSRLCASTCDNCPPPEEEEQDLYVEPLPPNDLCAGVECLASSDCKVAGTCEHITGGQCSAESDAADGVACNDGDPATDNDACISGNCVGVVIPNECTAIQSAIVERCLYGPPSDELEHDEIGLVPCEHCTSQLDDYLTIVSDCVLSVHVNENMQQQQQLPLEANGLLAAAYLRMVTGSCVNPCIDVTCPEGADCQVASRCNGRTGRCSPLTSASDGTPCGDNDASTDSACSAGACVATTSTAPPVPPTPTPPPADTANHAPADGDYIASVGATALATSLSDDFVTYQLVVTLGADATNLYTFYGLPSSPISFPPAYQCPTPFGTSVGGANPQFFAIANNPSLGYAEFDSWVTVGITDGDASGALSSIGLDFSEWSETTSLVSSDGAVFWMSPDDGPSAEVVLGQLTVASDASGTVTLGLQGRSIHGPDYQASGIQIEFGNAQPPVTNGCVRIQCAAASSTCKVAGACRPSDGICSPETNAVDGVACNDGDDGTENDACRDGVCAGTAIVSPSPPVPPPPSPPPPSTPPPSTPPPSGASGQLWLDVSIDDINALSSGSRRALENELKDYIASLFQPPARHQAAVVADDVVIRGFRAGSVVVDFMVRDLTSDQLQTGLVRSVTTMYYANLVVCSGECVLGYAVIGDNGVARSPVYRAPPSDGSGADSSSPPPSPPPSASTGTDVSAQGPAPPSPPGGSAGSRPTAAEQGVASAGTNVTAAVPSGGGDGFRRVVVGFHGFMKNTVAHHLFPEEEHLFDEWVRPLLLWRLVSLLARRACCLFLLY